MMFFLPLQFIEIEISNQLNLASNFNFRIYLNQKMQLQASVFTRRLYLPIYIPILALIASTLILSSRDVLNFGYFKFFMFVNGFITIAISEISIRYAGKNSESTITFIFLPIILFLINYLYLKFKLKN